MSVVHASTVFGRRTCALLAGGSAVLHAAMLGHAASPVFTGLLVAMIAACLYCARDLWLRGTLEIWCTVALMNLAMVALHTPMPAHHHDKGSTAEPSTLMMLTVLVALLEVAIAATVLYYRTRHRSVISPPAG